MLHRSVDTPVTSASALRQTRHVHDDYYSTKLIKRAQRSPDENMIILCLFVNTGLNDKVFISVAYLILVLVCLDILSPCVHKDTKICDFSLLEVCIPVRVFTQMALY